MVLTLLGQNSSQVRRYSDEELCELVASRDVAAFQELLCGGELGPRSLHSCCASDDLEI
jgi:hypothetical protein